MRTIKTTTGAEIVLDGDLLVPNANDDAWEARAVGDRNDDQRVRGVVAAVEHAFDETRRRRSEREERNTWLISGKGRVRIGDLRRGKPVRLDGVQVAARREAPADRDAHALAHLLLDPARRGGHEVGPGGVEQEHRGGVGGEQDPHPVHAYAAAGERAPLILRAKDGKQTIKCPRCGGLSPITANNCKGCGMPFTMEGTTLEAAGTSNGFCVASLVLGIIGLPAACTVIPPILALIFGIIGYRSLAVSDLPAIDFPGVESPVAYSDLSPRLGLNYDLFAVWARKREGQMLARALTDAANRGLIASHEVPWLVRIPGRRAAREYAKGVGGEPALRAMQEYQEQAIELGFLPAAPAAPEAAFRRQGEAQRRDRPSAAVFSDCSFDRLPSLAARWFFHSRC